MALARTSSYLSARKEDGMMIFSKAHHAVLALALVGVALTPLATWAGSAGEIDRDVDAALHRLFDHTPGTVTLGKEATAVLVFPSIVKAGFVFGAQYGEGALRKGNRTSGYYSSFAASYGLQAGVQSFGYALFFMRPSALEYLENSAGWEIGTGPSVVVLDVGAAKALTTTTLRDDVYAVIFDQRGLMAGFGVQGAKITRLEK